MMTDVEALSSWRPGLPGHRAVELLTAALGSIEHDESDPVYVRALASLGRATAFTGAIEEATLVVGRAIELARRLGDARLLADTLQASLWLGLRPPNLPGSRFDWGSALIAAALVTGLPVLLAACGGSANDEEASSRTTAVPPSRDPARA